MTAEADVDDDDEDDDEEEDEEDEEEDEGEDEEVSGARAGSPLVSHVEHITLVSSDVSSGK